MYNDFVIVDPKDAPAKANGILTAKQAFKAIADTQSTFAGRGDNSATQVLEQTIWASVGTTPTAQMLWYEALDQGMGETLLFSNEQEAYILGAISGSAPISGTPAVARR